MKSMYSKLKERLKSITTKITDEVLTYKTHI